MVRTGHEGSVQVIALLTMLSFVGCTSGQPSGDLTSAETNVEVGGGGHVFSYSLSETTGNQDDVLAQLVSDVTPDMIEAGATPYSVWLPPELPNGDLAREADRFGRGFAGLVDAQVGFMLAWSEDDLDVEALDDALSAVEGVAAVTTVTYDPLYLSDGLRVPTGRGFYVHREERYRPEDAAEAVRLSKAAWETWEPAWGTVVTGVFRERGAPADVARLLRIVWYRDFQHWVETREAGRVPEARQFFRARSELQLEGSGVAIATDRLVR